MNLSVTTTTHGGGDNSWLGSRHGVANARTVTLDADAFTGPIVPSGTPIAITAGLAVPFTDDATQDLVGFVIGDQSIADGDSSVPVLDHGRVIKANLPVAFTAPANAGAFIFV
jgi:hypothetical protein